MTYEVPYDLYPIENYTISDKPSKSLRRTDLQKRGKFEKVFSTFFLSLPKAYEEIGFRRVVDAVCLVNVHGHPHVLLLQDKQSDQFILPGGKIKPGESDIIGLQRKLDNKMAPTVANLKVEWDIGDLVGTWFRPEFDSNLYPYCPPHVTRPKEIRKVYLVQLPEKCYFYHPSNFNLKAVPLFEVYGDAKRYGPLISSLPVALSRLGLNISK